MRRGYFRRSRVESNILGSTRVSTTFAPIGLSPQAFANESFAPDTCSKSCKAEENKTSDGASLEPFHGNFRVGVASASAALASFPDPSFHGFEKYAVWGRGCILSAV